MWKIKTWNRNLGGNTKLLKCSEAIQTPLSLTAHDWQLHFYRRCLLLVVTLLTQVSRQLWWAWRVLQSQKVLRGSEASPSRQMKHSRPSERDKTQATRLTLRIIYTLWMLWMGWDEMRFEEVQQKLTMQCLYIHNSDRTEWGAELKPN